MSEEKIDNLHQADGNQNADLNNTNQSENQKIEAPIELQTLENEVLIADTEVEAPIENAVASNQQIIETEILAGEEIDKIEAQPIENQNTIELTDAEIANDELIVEDNTTAIAEESDAAMHAIATANAEESEDETIKGKHEIPMHDYEAMPMENLVEELEKLVAVEKLMSVKDHVEEVKKAFLSKYFHLIDEKREEFNAENPETTEKFDYSLPIKAKFDNLYNQYRAKKETHFKSLQTNLEANLKNRLALVEELKNVLHNPSGNIANSLKQVNEIRDKWKNAGPIPKDKYNHVWNNFHFHIENFYDSLHLDREARDLDFKHNLVLKEKIITRVEELIDETDINDSFRELQDLHRIWKEEIGPVSRDNREKIWNRFSELTKQMHDKREAYYEGFKAIETNNLAKKKELIEQIALLATQKVDSHSAWQKQMEKVEAVRNQFFSTGKVPSDVNEETWAGFKNAVRDFNILKNSFYKDIKKEQNDNLNKKQALVNKANELKDSDNFAETSLILKQIQEEWKTVGHVPRKFSDALWTEFRAACNHFFERLKDGRKEENAEEVQAFEKKKEYLETIREFQLIGDHKTDLDAIKMHIETWKSFGRVPTNRRHIEGKFNKILDALFEKLSSSKKEGEMIRFANKLDNLAGGDDRKIGNERIFITRKIDEVQNEIFQLENNIQFFANAKSNNPMILEVQKNIERQKEDLLVWKEKLKQINNLNKE